MSDMFLRRAAIFHSLGIEFLSQFFNALRSFSWKVPFFSIVSVLQSFFITDVNYMYNTCYNFHFPCFLIHFAIFRALPTIFLI